VLQQFFCENLLMLPLLLLLQIEPKKNRKEELKKDDGSCTKKY
jgi:hypothetical protein